MIQEIDLVDPRTAQTIRELIDEGMAPETIERELDVEPEDVADVLRSHPTRKNIMWPLTLRCQLKTAIEDYALRHEVPPISQKQAICRAIVHVAGSELQVGARVSLPGGTGLVMGVFDETDEVAVVVSGQDTVSWVKRDQVTVSPMRVVWELEGRDEYALRDTPATEWSPSNVILEKWSPAANLLRDCHLTDAEALRRALRYYVGLERGLGTRVVICERDYVLVREDESLLVAIDEHGTKSAFPRHLARVAPVSGALLDWVGGEQTREYLPPELVERRRQVMTQAEMGEALGVSDTYVCKWERGHESVTAEQLVAYQQALEEREAERTEDAA